MTQAKLQLIPPAIFIFALFFLPELPEFWIHRKKLKVKLFYFLKKASSHSTSTLCMYVHLQRANKSHRFYKGTNNLEYIKTNNLE